VWWFFKAMWSTEEKHTGLGILGRQNDTSQDNEFRKLKRFGGEDEQIGQHPKFGNRVEVNQAEKVDW
jgi:hypothetical protein